MSPTLEVPRLLDSEPPCTADYGLCRSARPCVVSSLGQLLHAAKTKSWVNLQRDRESISDQGVLGEARWYLLFVSLLRSSPDLGEVTFVNGFIEIQQKGTQMLRGRLNLPQSDYITFKIGSMLTF